MSDRKWLPLVFADPAQHTGCMVGLWLAPDTAAALAVQGGMAPESLHLTLCMLEEPADKLSDIGLARLLTTVDDVAAWTVPLAGEISGLGRFYASESSDGQDVVFAIPSIPELLKVREQLVRDLGYRSIETKDDFGFMPHITLAYVAPGAESPVAAVPTIPLQFDSLTVCVGDRMTTVPLRGYRDGAIVCADAVELANGLTCRLFNELPANEAFVEPPEWLPFLPVPGDYAHPRYGTVSLDEERIKRICASVDEGTYQKHLSINAEHQLDASGALGWFGETRINQDGSADVKPVWTPRGEEMLKRDSFRYVSPEWDIVWKNPVNEELIPDVAKGLALCQRPFFKDTPGVLRSLVASERGAAEQSLSMVYKDGEPVRFVFTRNAADAPPEVFKMSDQTPTTQQFTDLSQKFTELQGNFATLEQKFADSETARIQAEKSATENATKVANLEADKQRQLFTDEVLGRSKENKIRWFGDPEEHVATLELLPEEKRQRYIDSQRKLATQITASPILMSAVGSDSPPDNTDVMSEVNSKAQKFRDEHPEITMAQAIATVTEADPSLARRYRESKQN